MQTAMPIRTLRLACLVASLATCSMPAIAGCVLDGQAPGADLKWKVDGFQVANPAERGKRALALADCLGNPDPGLRDGIAFEALSGWMRGKQLDMATLRQLQQRLFLQLEGDDDEGFRKPFAALALSEIARTDRVQPWMTPNERARMADKATAYLRSVRDYRGYVDGQGWRHGIAHGADWALQLALNKSLSPAHLWPMLDAVASQVAPANGHAYAFGEPTRLARAVAYAVARGDLEQSAVDAWLAGLVTALGPRPEGDAQATWWARRANLENFLHALGLMAAGETTPSLLALSAGVNATLAKLP